MLTDLLAYTTIVIYCYQKNIQFHSIKCQPIPTTFSRTHEHAGGHLHKADENLKIFFTHIYTV